MESDQDNCPKLPWMIDFHSTEKGEVPNNQFQANLAKSHLQYLSALNIQSKPPNFRSTRLLCTIPLNATCEAIEELLKQNISLVRIHLSIFNKEKAEELLAKIRFVVEKHSKKVGRIYPLAVAMEIRGPELHTGILRDYKKKEILLQKGKITNITTDKSFEEFVNEDMIFVDYQKLHEVVQPGDRFLINNGNIALSAIEVAESIVKCIVEKAGKLISNSSVELLDTPIDFSEFAKYDLEILKFAMEQSIDVLFVAGTLNCTSINQIKTELEPKGHHILIFSIIENPTTIKIAEEIIQASDGILIDCDKLMQELPKEKVFLAQKSLIAKSNLAGKPAYCTLNFSNYNAISKSEVCDIANAIIDGTEGFLIPPESCAKKQIKEASIICMEAEAAVHQPKFLDDVKSSIQAPYEPIYSLTIAAVEAAQKSCAAAIICLTCSGRTAKLLSRFRPKCPIIVITRYPRIARQMACYKCIDPILYLKEFDGDYLKDVDDRIQLGITYGKHRGYIRIADAVVSISSARFDSGMPNVIKIIYATHYDVKMKGVGS